MPGQRSLAAIVFTDVVSFSARMQENENVTLQLLRQDFDTMRQMCVEHEGSVLKTTGDGLLLHFASAVQAVACALAIQRSFAEREKAPAAEKPLSHRVGIHLGDVFFDKEDVMGDGVNIAARLQAEAEPGGICISQTVYHVVRNKLALQVTRLGPRELKNISQAIPIYRLLLKAQSMEDPANLQSLHHDDDSHPPVRPPVVSRRTWYMVVAMVLVAGAGIFGLQALARHRIAVARAEAKQVASNALDIDQQTPEARQLARRVSVTVANWRRELREKRSRALEEYDFGALSRDLQDPKSPVASKPEEVRIRAEVLLRTEKLFNWLTTVLQRYNRQNPLIVHELTGTAPMQIKVFAGADRRLYTTEGGAIRQRNWKELKPALLAAIVAGAIIQAESPPPREAVQGALAFASLYGLPELPAALKEERVSHFQR
jgi:class 3 adenylate cyclase